MLIAQLSSLEDVAGWQAADITVTLTEGTGVQVMWTRTDAEGSHTLGESYMTAPVLGKSTHLACGFLHCWNRYTLDSHWIEPLGTDKIVWIKSEFKGQ